MCGLAFFCAVSRSVKNASRVGRDQAHRCASKAASSRAATGAMSSGMAESTRSSIILRLLDHTALTQPWPSPLAVRQRRWTRPRPRLAARTAYACFGCHSKSAGSMITFPRTHRHSLGVLRLDHKTRPRQRLTLLSYHTSQAVLVGQGPKLASH